MNDLLYPASPANIDSGRLLPSVSFRQQVSKVIKSIVLFFIVYLLLLLAAAGLAVACFYLGISLIIAFPKFLVLVIGIGLIILGISVFLFLVKFIFAVSKNENDSRTMITESEQPELFNFIRKLTEETRTPFPGKIYISDDVNAGVFYNSSFWSMFLPVKKNLQIGLGLVNSVNISEFKAVIGHEFGHFSQRSMKLGSFTYNVNQVIYNMLFENSGYGKFLDSWARIHGLFSIFVSITIKIAQGIQWILKQMYQVINKNYLALSREMEFHADAIAASVAGGNNLVTALSRLELASTCYTAAIDNANELLKQNRNSRNIFSNQLSVFQSLAKDHKLPVKQDLPEVSFQFIQTYSRSRVNFTNQWASHPTLEERKGMLDKLSINIDPVETRAWTLFANAEKLQEQMTRHLYRTVLPESLKEEYDSAFFNDWYDRKKNLLVLPEEYNGFYDGRFISTSGWDFDAVSGNASLLSFNHLFTEENGQLQASITMNENDLATVKAIGNREIDVTSFDFDGIKYSASDTDLIIRQLEKEMEEQRARQGTLDREAYNFFFHRGGLKSGELRNMYLQYQHCELEYDAFFTLAGNIMGVVYSFYEGNLTLEEVSTRVSALKDLYETELKKQLTTLLNEKAITSESDEELFGKINHFINSSYAYFIVNEFQSHELNDLNELTEKVNKVLYDRRFNLYKNILHAQLEYL